MKGWDDSFSGKLSTNLKDKVLRSTAGFLFSVKISEKINMFVSPLVIVYVEDFNLFLDQGTLVTIMILSFRTDRYGQTVQTQIRLLLEEQSDQGLHCLLFNLHLFDEIHYGLALC